MKRWISLLPVLITIISAQSQVVADYSSSISSFKTKYPKTDIVAVEYKEEYSFNIATVKNESKVGVLSSISETLVPLKDFTKSSDAVFYDDESSIESVRAGNSKTKSIKVSQQCMDYQSEGIFHSDAKLCLFSVPLETKGIPVNFSYEKKFRDIKYLTSVYFHESIPVESKTIVFNVPEWLDIEMREFNFEGYDIKKQIVKDEINKLTRYTFTCKEIPAIDKEARSPNWAKTYPHVVVVSKSYTENGQKKTLFGSVSDLYGWYHSLTLDVKNDPAEIKPVVAQLTADKKTDIEKIESVFYWVQDKIRYIAFENGIMGFKPDAAQNVLKNKYGDCKGKANLLTQMLRLAGYDARLTWIGTSDLPYDYSLPSLVVDNHMICTVIVGGKRYFLDGTEENIAFNDYAHRIQGKQVLIEDGDKYIIDKIPEFPAERNKVENIIKLKTEGEALSGNYSTIYNGEAKIGLVGAYQSLRNDNKKDAFENYLRSSNPNITVANIKNPDWKDRKTALQVSFDVKANHQITKAGNELYINLDWEKELGGLEFDSTRKNDYELGHKYFISTQIEFAIPDGYKSDYLPEPVKINKPDYSFEGSYAVKGSNIVYTKKIVVNSVIIKKKQFQDWNQFIKSINTFYSDQLVLVKK